MQPSTSCIPSARVPWLVPIALFAFAMVWNWVPPQADAADNGWYESINVARGLANSGGWANPMRTIQTGPTAHMAPVFPLLVSIFLRDNPNVVTMFYRLFNIELMAIAAMCASLPAVALAAGMGWKSGAAAAFVMIVMPLGRSPQWESHLAGFVITLLTVFSLTFWRVGQSTWGAVMLGFLWGACLLLSANFALVLLFLVVAAVVGGLRPRFLVAGVLAVMAVLAPWTARNFVQLGAFVPIRSNLGLELSVSNNDCAHPSFRANLRYECFQSRHPNESAAQGNTMRKMGELKYYDSLKSEAIGWIWRNPAAFGKLTFRRWVLFWIPYDPQDTWSNPGLTITPHYAKVVTVATFLSIPGLFWLFGTCPLAAIWFSVWLTAFPLVHYVVQFEARYRYPIIWITFLLASHAVVTIIERTRQTFHASSKSAASFPLSPDARRE